MLHHRLTLMTLCLALLLVTTTSRAADSAREVDEELRALLLEAANDADSFVDQFDAQVWLLDMSTRLEKKVPDPKTRIDLLKQIHYEATRVNVKPEIILAIIEVESNFNPYAISRAGAHGLMQIMPFWLKEIGRPGDSLFDVKTNLRFGCTILKFYLDKEKGNLFRALGRYNGSLGKWKYPGRVYNAFNTRWQPQ
ncbi:MAG: lytic transglycosylase domain-containing protein [Gammaproteobacteria bacterium]|nr:lytic transglycosylase domain-containing protein [Gammaproteobacteria bacterium]